MNNQQLEDLLSLNPDVILLEGFDADPSIDLWWQDKRRRLNQHQRNRYKKERKLLPRLAAPLQWLRML